MLTLITTEVIPGVAAHTTMRRLTPVDKPWKCEHAGCGEHIWYEEQLHSCRICCADLCEEHLVDGEEGDICPDCAYDERIWRGGEAILQELLTFFASPDHGLSDVDSASAEALIRGLMKRIWPLPSLFLEVA